MRITFYATLDVDGVNRSNDQYMPSVPYLLPASSWSRKGLPKPKLPIQARDTAVDSGGFVATFKWGDYRYTPDEYIKWALSFDTLPRWNATMDYCCEPEIAGTEGIVRDRQNRTTDMAWLFWKNYKHLPITLVPTIQGWEVEDYERHAKELHPLIQEMQSYYYQRDGVESHFRVGVGTLCRRTKLIHDVLYMVSSVLTAIPLHAWGVKMGSVRSKVALPHTLTSVDSAAWNSFFYGGHEIRRESGLTKRCYGFTIALPAYIKKFNEAVDSPKIPYKKQATD